MVCDVNGDDQGLRRAGAAVARVAEVRSLVVSKSFRRVGVAARLIEELKVRARADGFESLCAFTHDARFFVRQNFSIVPHLWLPEKIATDCVTCPLFRACGQYAMILPLEAVARYASACRGAPRPGRVTVAPVVSPGVTRFVDGGVTAPAGFRAAGVACGIKRRTAAHASAPLDLALVAADGPVSAAAVFTTNKRRRRARRRLPRAPRARPADRRPRSS